MTDPIAEFEAELAAKAAERRAQGKCDRWAGKLACELPPGHDGPHEAWLRGSYQYRWGSGLSDD